eukprot:4974207-Pyramimonas_sp.AAC.1
MWCNQCGALDAVQHMVCNIRGATDVVQATRCNLCNAISVAQRARHNLRAIYVAQAIPLESRRHKLCNTTYMVQY